MTAKAALARGDLGEDVRGACGPDERLRLDVAVGDYAADPQAKGALAADSQPTGHTALPTMDLHAIDPTVSPSVDPASCRPDFIRLDRLIATEPL